MRRRPLLAAALVTAVAGGIVLLLSGGDTFAPSRGLLGPVLVGGPAILAAGALARPSRPIALSAGLLVLLLALTGFWFGGALMLPAGVLLLAGAAVGRA